MLTEGRRAADRIGLANIRWVRALAEDFHSPDTWQITRPWGLRSRSGGPAPSRLPAR
jgi:hypothetical protein